MDFQTEAPLPGAASPGPAAAAERARTGDLLRAALIFLVVALLARAMAFVPAVIDSDEGLFILQAREWLRGGWPLVAVWDMHPVGAPAVMAVGMALMGQSLFAIRMLGVLAVVATALALHCGARAAGAPRGVALASGILYCALSVLVGGLTTGTEILMAPFVAAPMAIALAGGRRAARRFEAPGWGALIAIGLLVGWALVIKPVAFPMGCLAFALLVAPPLWSRALGVGRLLGLAGAYALLCATPTLVLAFAYWLKGDLSEFLDGSFMAPFRYTDGRVGLGLASRQTLAATLVLLAPVLVAAAGLACRDAFRLSGWYGRVAVAGLLWFAAACVAIIGPGMFYQHYFLLWLPPLAWLAALGAWRLAGLAGAARMPALLWTIVGALALSSWQYEFSQRFQRGVGFHQPDPVREVVEILRREGAPGDSLFVANYHTTIYFLAGAPVPTRYIFPGHITGPFSMVPAEDMNVEIARILAAAPRFIVVDRGWWDVMHEGAQEQLAHALHDHYTIVGRVQEERGDVEIWRRL